MRDYIAAHRKAIIGVVGAVAVLLLDADTAQEVVGVATLVLAWFVPNDQDAVARIYGP